MPVLSTFCFGLTVGLTAVLAVLAAAVAVDAAVADGSLEAVGAVADGWGSAEGGGVTVASVAVLGGGSAVAVTFGVLVCVSVL